MTALLVPALPLAAALLLQAVRNPAAGRWIARIAAALTFALAASLPWQPGHDPLLLVDPLSTLLAILSAGTGVAATLSADPQTGRGRALMMALLGLTLLALLSNHVGLTWLALQAASFAAARLVGLPGTQAAAGGLPGTQAAAGGLPGTQAAREAAWRATLLSSVALAIAFFGIVALALAASSANPPSLTWTALAQAAPELQATLLNLAFACLLLGLAASAALVPLQGLLATPAGPAAAMLALALPNVALVILLRLRNLLAANPLALDPGPPLMAVGVLALLLACLAMTGQRDLRRSVSALATGQFGLAAFAIGLGGPGATFAALLQITMQTLAGSALLLGVGRYPGPIGLLTSGRAFTLGCAMIAVAGLPPFGLFASHVLILSETLRLHPWLLPPLAAGLVITAWSLIARLVDLCLGDPPCDLAPTDPAPPDVAPFGRLALIPAWIQLALAGVLGFAMPQPVAAWLAAAAGLPR